MRNFILYGFCFSVLMIGCGMPKSDLKTTLWKSQNGSAIGTLTDGRFEYAVVVSDFQKFADDGMGKTSFGPKFLIGVSVECTNKTNDTLILDRNRIQIVSQHQLLKQLTLKETNYMFIGGSVDETLLWNRLQYLNNSPSSHWTEQALKAAERRMVIDQLRSKEHFFYQSFHQSFEPSSLPGGVSMVWAQYYYYTRNPIKIVLEGQQLSEGVTFSLPPEGKPPRDYKNVYRGLAIIGGSLILILLWSSAQS
ncbi:MAG: hypothetical protein OXC79_10910 [Candidatus Poribacteria bacterium]|nr:hypothetical protein [Candidatus Poribacteria bacterium]